MKSTFLDFTFWEEQPRLGVQADRQGKGETGDKGKATASAKESRSQTDVLSLHQTEPNRQRMGQLLPHREHEHLPQREVQSLDASQGKGSDSKTMEEMWHNLQESIDTKENPQEQP